MAPENSIFKQGTQIDIFFLQFVQYVVCCISSYFTAIVQFILKLNLRAWTLDSCTKNREDHMHDGHVM